jgi:hypothetical protein
MHWIDPTQLPAVHGTVERFLCNPHGELDGLILRDGTEVHFPPHLSEAVRSALKPGAAVKIHGLRPRSASMLIAVQLTASESQRVIVDDGPDDRLRHEQPRRPFDVQGRVARTLHGPKGEPRGALLEDGSIVRLGKHARAEARALLTAGSVLAARGEGVSGAPGLCVEAKLIGSSFAKLEPVGGKPHDKPAKPKDKPKDKKPKAEHAPAAPGSTA